MRKPAYKVGEKINWLKQGETQMDEGIIGVAVAWQSTFTYLIRSREPHTWVKEEEINGHKERRALRDKLDNQMSLPPKTNIAGK